MELCRVILKIVMWILIIYFSSNFIMQSISYSFYKGEKQTDEVRYVPVKLQFNQKLSGYGYNLELDSDKIIIFFGGSNYIAYNSVAEYGGIFSCPFVSADYYGTQESNGKMKLKTMKQTAVDLYDWAIRTYPDKKISVIGHSYGTGMAVYLASARECDSLVLLAAYRDLSDLYNKIIPIFWGPAKLFISNNIRIDQYAEKINCNTFIIGSTSDRTLGGVLQEKVQLYFENSELKMFDRVEHNSYLLNEQVIHYINKAINIG